jgi:hypothetical protein
MAASAEDCRDYAKRCIEMANNSADEKFQSWLFEMAREWNQHAAELERNAALRAKLRDAPIKRT